MRAGGNYPEEDGGGGRRRRKAEPSRASQRRRDAATSAAAEEPEPCPALPCPACPRGRAPPPPRPPDMSEHKAVDPKLSTTDRVVKGGCCAPAALSAGSSRRARVRVPSPPRAGTGEAAGRGGLGPGACAGPQWSVCGFPRLPARRYIAAFPPLPPPAASPRSALKALHRAGVRERGSPSFLPRLGAWGSAGQGSAPSPSPPAPLGISHSSSFSSGPRSPEPPSPAGCAAAACQRRSAPACSRDASLETSPRRQPGLRSRTGLRSRGTDCPPGSPCPLFCGSAVGAGRGRGGRRRSLLPPPPPPPPSPSLVDGPACEDVKLSSGRSVCVGAQTRLGSMIFPLFRRYPCAASPGRVNKLEFGLTTRCAPSVQTEVLFTGVMPDVNHVRFSMCRKCTCI